MMKNIVIFGLEKMCISVLIIKKKKNLIEIFLIKFKTFDQIAICDKILILSGIKPLPKHMKVEYFSVNKYSHHFK